MGRSVLKPWGTGLRRLTVAPFVVFYKFDATDLQVIRIIHSSRDIDEAKLDT
jgi:toxin ParE1/3/4